MDEEMIKKIRAVMPDQIARDAWYQITEVFPSLKDCLDLGEK